MGLGCVLTEWSSVTHGACLDPQYVTAACGMVAEMVEALPLVLALGHKRNSSAPAFLTPVLKNIVVSLARLPLVNSYTRVPPLVSLSLPLHRTQVMGTRRQAPARDSESAKPLRCPLAVARAFLGCIRDTGLVSSGVMWLSRE